MLCSHALLAVDAAQMFYDASMFDRVAALPYGWKKLLVWKFKGCLVSFAVLWPEEWDVILEKLPAGFPSSPSSIFLSLQNGALTTYFSEVFGGDYFYHKK